MRDPLLISTDVDAIRRRYEGEKPQRVDRAFRSWLRSLTGAEPTGDWRTVPIPGGGFYLRLNEDRLHRIRVASSIDSSKIDYDLSCETLSLLASVLAFSELSVLYPADYRKLRAHVRSHPDEKTMRAIEVRLLDYLG